MQSATAQSAISLRKLGSSAKQEDKLYDYSLKGEEWRQRLNGGAVYVFTRKASTNV